MATRLLIESVRDPELFVSCEVREGRATLGIDIVAVCPAPVGECVRIDVSLHDEIPLSPQAISELFRCLEPVFPSRVKLLRILHDGKDTGVVFASIPGDACRSNGGGHA